MCEAPMVAYIVERLQDGNARFQDARGHLGFHMPAIAQALHLLPKEAMQWLFARDG